MFVSSYQIRNVLNVYSKQLSQDKSARKEKTTTNRPLADQIDLSTEGKRRAMIERVADDILNKIINYGTNGKIKGNPGEPPRERIKKQTESVSKKETEFVFNFIDDLNRKTKTALSVKDTNFLIGMPEPPAKEAVEKDLDS
jgi:hypothetical protein